MSIGGEAAFLKDVIEVNQAYAEGDMLKMKV